LARGDLPGRRLLHFAPEPLFDPVFERLPEVERVTADLYAPADLRLDVTHMDLPDSSFDLILCSHVLEHVPDDREAMGELRRVLRDGGQALVLVPYRPGVTTYEDPSITSPLDRMVAFGQQDHVRIYGNDLPDRLRQAGFEVDDRTAADLFDEATVERCELDSEEHFFLCRAAGPSSLNG
jgi:SAM-dependent methyltransferase